MTKKKDSKTKLIIAISAICVTAFIIFFGLARQFVLTHFYTSNWYSEFDNFTLREDDDLYHSGRFGIFEGESSATEGKGNRPKPFPKLYVMINETGPYFLPELKEQNLIDAFPKTVGNWRPTPVKRDTAVYFFPEYGKNYAEFSLNGELLGLRVGGGPEKGVQFSKTKDGSYYWLPMAKKKWNKVFGTPNRRYVEYQRIRFIH